MATYGDMMSDSQFSAVHAGFPGMVAERQVWRSNGWSTPRGDYADLFSATTTPRSSTPVQQNIMPGRHRSQVDMHRSSSPRGARRARSERVLPQGLLDEQLASEQLERRLAQIEASQRTNAQCGAREAAKVEVLTAAIEKMSERLDKLTNGLVDHVLEPIQNL